MAKTNKYKYFVVLQQNNGYGWDDLEEFETNSSFILDSTDRKELSSLKKEYKIAQRGASLRTIHRKTPKRK